MMNKITKALAVSMVLTFPAAISRKLLLQNGWPVIRTLKTPTELISSLREQ